MKYLILSVCVALISNICVAGTKVTTTVSVKGKNMGSTTTTNPDGSKKVDITCDNNVPLECYSITTVVENGAIRLGDEITIAIYNDFGEIADQLSGKYLGQDAAEVGDNRTQYTFAFN